MQAAAAYTGLSPEAVEWLHIGLADFECDGVGISETDRKNNLEMASMLIQSDAFTDMIRNLYAAYIAAYSEYILTILLEHHSEEYLPEDYSPEEYTCEDDIPFQFKKDEDRAVVMENLIHAIHVDPRRDPRLYSREEIENYDDDELMSLTIYKLQDFREKKALHQFHASKAFSGYLDYAVECAQATAEKRFSNKTK